MKTKGIALIISIFLLATAAVNKTSSQVSAGSAGQSKASQSQAILSAKGLTSVLYYPDWKQFKEMFDLVFLNSTLQAQRKKIYLVNLMYYVEDSFKNYPNTYKVTNNSDLSYKEYPKGFRLPRTVPTFNDLIRIYNKTYSNAAERTYRQKVFNDNMAVLPFLTNYSDLTPEEFEDHFLPANLVLDDSNNTQFIQYKIFVMRNQSKKGSFSDTRRIMDVNLQDISKSKISEQQDKPSNPNRNPSSANLLKFAQNLTPFRSQTFSTTPTKIGNTGLTTQTPRLLPLQLQPIQTSQLRPVPLANRNTSQQTPIFKPLAPLKLAPVPTSSQSFRAIRPTQNLRPIPTRN